MVLKEQTQTPISALPVTSVKDHLRLGTGFADDGMQDNLIVAYIRAALFAIEAKTGKAIFSRTFLLNIYHWRGDGSGLAFPVAPVSKISSINIIDAAGVKHKVEPNKFYLEQDNSRPRLFFKGGGQPTIPECGRLEVLFDAGFGKNWDNIPADLAQAIILLASHYYECRHECGLNVSHALPVSVQSLIESWRTVRLIGSSVSSLRGRA